MKRVDEVIDFWFETLRPKDWWSAAPDVDARIAMRFATLYDACVADPPAPAALDARGLLAAVLVFDQFPRHLFRGTARAFATDALAQAMTVDALDRGLDSTLERPQRQFVYMPLMHAEDIVLQRRSLTLFATLDDPRALRSARRHHDTFVRFGRFPDRDAARGRA